MPFSIGYPSPGSITQNLDTVLTLAFANAGNTIFDNISRNNAFFYEIKKNGMYEGIDSLDPYIEVPLMYGLGNMEWYEGWDTLGTQPTEGITAAVYPWRQAACAAGYNRREARVTSSQKIKEISKVKIEQAQLTMIDGFNKSFWWGNAQAPGGNLYTPIVSPTTSRSGMEPAGELIYFQSGLSYGQVTTSLTVGGLNQNTNAWWANWSHDATSISTYVAFLAAVDQMIEQSALGVGGQVDLIVCDPTTRRLLNSAYYVSYRRLLEKDNDYPFDNLMFRGAHVISDQDIPNVGSAISGNGAGSMTDTSVATGLGTMYGFNSKFFKMKYDKECNFILTDLQKPVNQDGKVGHVMWMGNAMVTNRRKHFVIGNIARSMS